MKLIKVKNIYKDSPLWLNAEKILMLTKSIENRVVVTMDDMNVFEVEESFEDIIAQISGKSNEPKKTK